MARRAESGREWRPDTQLDPRAAILQFHRQLAERNIRLLLMPTPDKVTIHPEKYSSRYEGRRISIHNPSYPQFLAELEAAGVLVCDVTGALADYCERSGKPVYLATDTHWRPEAMELAAAELAGQIEQQVVFDASTEKLDQLQKTQDIKNLGDIAMMLNLRQNQGVFGREVVTTHQVTDAAGVPWRADPTAEVLVLGDSFANIYSLGMMNWGSAAGLAEQLSFALQRPVDTILRNDEGAYATREILSRELAQGEDRLAGKKVVVWQFAARELAVGHWKLLDMTLKQSRRPVDSAPPAGGELIVSGTIATKSAAPRAGQIPYAHHIFTLDLIDLQVHSGTLTEPKIAVYLFSLRNHQNTAAFSWPVGKRVKLELQPWRPDFFRKFGRINRTDSDNLELEQPWWGEILK
jgi:alginate O-acetyltransferase complex protein AlgJ